jgi:hypothetical protein
LLERPYHYPPNAVQDQLNRQTFLGQSVAVEYEPLAADPDFLVVGPMAKLWQLYARVIDAGEFERIPSCSRYDVYQRVR